ncbi:MAG TPA: hypothetical protein VFX70_00310 [Mycobacteriales bacterium]|nr:hypothetical protein [Mycobacteriales bacterium]
MTEPWGQVADKEMLVADPANIPDESVKPRMTVRCPGGHKLVKVYDPIAYEFDGLGEPTAVWYGPVFFADVPETSAGYFIWHRLRHIGNIPEHIVGYDHFTGAPVRGANIGGFITAECPGKGLYSIHTWQIQRWWDLERRFPRLPDPVRCRRGVD